MSEPRKLANTKHFGLIVIYSFYNTWAGFSVSTALLCSKNKNVEGKPPLQKGLNIVGFPFNNIKLKTKKEIFDDKTKSV